MCLRDVLAMLREGGIDATETQIRWAINSGKVSRPALDGSLRFDFEGTQVQELLAYFATKHATGPKARTGRPPA